MKGILLVRGRDEKINTVDRGLCEVIGQERPAEEAGTEVEAGHGFPTLVGRECERELTLRPAVIIVAVVITSFQFGKH